MTYELKTVAPTPIKKKMSFLPQKSGKKTSDFYRDCENKNEQIKQNFFGKASFAPLSPSTRVCPA